MIGAQKGVDVVFQLAPDFIVICCNRRLFDRPVHPLDPLPCRAFQVRLIAEHIEYSFECISLNPAADPSECAVPIPKA